MGGGSLTAAFGAVKSGQVKTVVVLENDLYRRAEAKSVDALLAAAEHVIVIDHTGNATTAKAHVVLPAGTFAESDGTLVNNEGRAQRFYRVMTPDGEVRESWRWLRDLMLAAGRSEVAEWTNIDDVQSALAAALPVFQPIREVAPPADFRLTGLRIARQPTRYSGRTAMSADVNLHEPQPPEDLDSPLSFSMEGYQGQPPSPLVPRFWAPGWNSVQALNKYQEEVGEPLRGGDPGKRLIEPDENCKAPYLPGVPREGERPMGYYILVPAHHIFGSEELSVLAPGIAQLAPQPYVGLSPDDARGSSLEEGQEVEVTCGEWSRRLPVKIISTLPGGTLALPVGLAGFGWLDLPALGELRNSREDAR
jgi:NADH-quinone oxidoreductase subunit G